MASHARLVNCKLRPAKTDSDTLGFAGSACALGNEGSLDWLQNNFGAFAAKARYEDFTRLMANFNGVSPSFILFAKVGFCHPHSWAVAYAGSRPLEKYGTTCGGKYYSTGMRVNLPLNYLIQ